MKKLNHTKKIMFILILSLVYIVGCTKTETINIDEPNPSTPSGSMTDDHLASGTSPKMSEDSAKAMQLEKSIQDVQQIILKDLEGNVIKDNFSQAEMEEITQAFNDSFIMDTAYIEMIAGYTMDILLKDARHVFIHSYGEPTYIVASIDDGQTYHLGCELIGKILLDSDI